MPAARLVGSNGEMVGVERDPAAVATLAPVCRASRDIQRRFVQGDVRLLDGFDGNFDAIVGRLVLMYLPDRSG
jgi:hypothetical protein